jgi:sulfonate transport system ATP-binding protein
MLSIRGLSKTYATGTKALEAVTLEVGAGEILAIVGGSGCGKTTLLRLVGGLDQASAGLIKVDDAEIAGPHPAVGIVFQEPRLMPWLSVADNVGFGIASLALPERKARVADAIARVGLSGYEERWPRELSGGQQQRVAIARAFVARPKVLLLDEPFSALDAFTRASLHEHLLALWQEQRPTVVMVTHDVEEAVTLADRIIVMRPKPGRVFETVTAGLERPRDKLAVGFDKAKRRVLNALDRSLKAQDAEPGTSASGGAELWW